MIGMKGDVYPVVAVSHGCILQANFGQTDFDYEIPPKFDPVIFSQDLI